MAPTLYYLPCCPPCRSVLLLSKILGLEFDLKVTNIFAGDQMKPEYIEMNPQHCVPTLNDDGLILWESRAILSYIVSAFGKDDDSLYPKDVRVRALVDQRLMFDLGVLYQRMADYYYPTIRMGVPPDEAKKANIMEAMEWFDMVLKNRTFAAADHFTIADITLLVTVSQLEAFEFDLQPYENVIEWYQRCKEFAEAYDYENINGKAAGILADMYKAKLQN